MNLERYRRVMRMSELSEVDTRARQLLPNMIEAYRELHPQGSPADLILELFSKSAKAIDDRQPCEQVLTESFAQLVVICALHAGLDAWTWDTFEQACQPVIEQYVGARLAQCRPAHG